MTHPRQSVRQAVAQLATNVATVLGPTDAVGSQASLDIDTPSDEAIDETLGAERTILLEVTAFAANRDEVDRLLEQIETRVASDPTLAGAVDFTEYAGFVRRELPDTAPESVQTGTSSWTVHVRH